MLSDYFTRHLNEEDRGSVEQHLAGCRTCRIHLRTMALVAGKPETVLTDRDIRHFSPTLLSRYYADVGSLDEKLVKRIEEHLESCDECRQDLDFLKNSDLDLRHLISSIGQAKPSTGWFSKLMSLFRRSR